MSFGFFAVILGPLMRLVYGILPNFAVTLIVFTVLVRVVSLPLNIKQQKSMAKTAVFQPLMTEIQEKYKNNQQKQQEELMKLQQEYGFNPMAGCWPMLIDMIVLFGVIEVVYRPVQYILGVPAAAITQACEELGLSGSFNALQIIEENDIKEVLFVNYARVVSLPKFLTQLRELMERDYVVWR